MITDRDIAVQVVRSVDYNRMEFDINAIVGEIQRTYGLVDIETIDNAEYWAIVQRHAR
jgi:hypothetical protein